MLRVANSMDFIHTNGPQKAETEQSTGLGQLFDVELMQILGNSEQAPEQGSGVPKGELAGLLTRKVPTSTGAEILKEMGIQIQRPNSTETRHEVNLGLSRNETSLSADQLQKMQQLNSRVQHHNPMHAFKQEKGKLFQPASQSETVISGKQLLSEYAEIRKSDSQNPFSMFGNLNNAKKAKLMQYKNAQQGQGLEGNQLASKIKSQQSSMFKSLENGFSDENSLSLEGRFGLEGEKGQSEGFSKISNSSSQTVLGTTHLMNMNKENAIQANQVNPEVTNDLGEVSQKILDYIKQNVPLKERSVEVNFHHETVGNVLLEVSQAGKDGININIKTLRPEGFEFFDMNKVDIMKSLSSSGIKVSDFNISQDSSFGQNLFSSDDQSKQGQQREGREDSDRRKELWEMFEKRKSA